jgi:hypothetical protein
MTAMNCNFSWYSGTVISLVNRKYFSVITVMFILSFFSEIFKYSAGIFSEILISERLSSAIRRKGNSVEGLFVDIAVRSWN